MAFGSRSVVDSPHVLASSGARVVWSWRRLPAELPREGPILGPRHLAATVSWLLVRKEQRVPVLVTEFGTPKCSWTRRPDETELLSVAPVIDFALSRNSTFTFTHQRDKPHVMLLFWPMSCSLKPRHQESFPPATYHEPKQSTAPGGHLWCCRQGTSRAGLSAGTQTPARGQHSLPLDHVLRHLCWYPDCPGLDAMTRRLTREF